MGQMLRRNADSGVAHLDAQIMEVGPSAERDLAARWRVVKRVVEKIDQCLLEPLCITEDGWDRLGFKRQCDSAVIGKQGQFIHQILNHGF